MIEKKNFFDQSEYKFDFEGDLMIGKKYPQSVIGVRVR